MKAAHPGMRSLHIDFYSRRLIAEAEGGEEASGAVGCHAAVELELHISSVGSEPSGLHASASQWTLLTGAP